MAILATAVAELCTLNKTLKIQKPEIPNTQSITTSTRIQTPKEVTVELY